MPHQQSPTISGRSVVGIDLDGVVADYVGGLRPYAAAHFGLEPHELPTPTTYDLTKAWPFTDLADYLALHRESVADGLYRALPLIDGAAAALRELSDAGAHIRIVTHRLFMGGVHAQVVADTAAWLDAVDIPYMSLCFTGLKDSVGAHVYVEDAPRMITTLRGEGWRTVVFDQPYNRDLDGPRITRWEKGFDVLVPILREAGQVLDQQPPQRPTET